MAMKPNSARKAQRDAERYWSDPERHRARSRQYKSDNREIVRKLNREKKAQAYASDPEKFRERKRTEYRENPEKRLERERLWRLNNPEKAREKDNRDHLHRDREADHRARILRTYGLTPDQFDALVADQSNKCGICQIEFTDRPQIDHCHNTGRVRGLLCNPCNTGIGMLRDDPDRVRSALNYLERTSCQSE